MKTLISARPGSGSVKNSTRHGDLAIRDRFRRSFAYLINQR